MRMTRVSFSFENIFSAGVGIFRTKHVLLLRKKVEEKAEAKSKQHFAPFSVFLYPANFGSLGQKCGRKERKKVEVQQLEQQLVSNA